MGAAAAVLVPVFAAAQSSDVQRFAEPEAYWHLLDEPPVVQTAWREAPTLIEQTHSEALEVEITVNERGEVVAADAVDGPLEYQADAEAVALTLRFEPFERDGHPVSASFRYRISTKPDDYVGPAERDFPTDIDPSTVEIRLQRSRCFGTCAAYTIEITGDGAVTYRGKPMRWCRASIIGPLHPRMWRT